VDSRRKTKVGGITQPSKMVRKLARDVADGKPLPRGKKTVITGVTDPSTSTS
jgi:hypothetical protein